MKRVFFWVQHLLGTGHLRRAATLVRALSAGGFDTLLVSGGAPVPGLGLGGARFHQLPPLRAVDDRVKILGHLDGTPANRCFLDARRLALLALLRAEQPDIVVTEQFPFGRTQMTDELVPLVETARALSRRPLIVSSVRDVVRERASPQRVAQMLETFDAWFDLLLIHADPEIVGFGESFAGWRHVAERARYTGFVLDGEPSPRRSGDDGAGEVIVSAGGGAVGGALLHAAVAARPLTTLNARTWRLLAGANLPARERETLQTSNGIGDGLIIEAARADFTTLLANAALSISQGGYNTVIETLAFADRAVIVPFATERETEQTRRAEVLARRGMVQVLHERELDGRSLAAAVERALAGRSLRSFPRCDVGGAPKTADILRSVA